MTNDLITDAIVEAATVASINVALAPYGAAITTMEHLQGGVEALAEMRAALEAVAPLIVAKAWEEGYDTGTTHGIAYQAGDDEALLRPVNPYRAIKQPMADPLDESDHRVRHDEGGRHWRKDGQWWTTDDPRRGNWTLAEIAAVLGPLTFCDCGAATVEAECFGCGETITHDGHGHGKDES